MKLKFLLEKEGGVGTDSFMSYVGEENNLGHNEIVRKVTENPNKKPNEIQIKERIRRNDEILPDRFCL